MSKAALMASEVDILKTKAANKKGAGSEEVETVWPKPEFVRLATTLSLRPFPRRGEITVTVYLAKWARVVRRVE